MVLRWYQGAVCDFLCQCETGRGSSLSQCVCVLLWLIILAFVSHQEISLELCLKKINKEIKEINRLHCTWLDPTIGAISNQISWRSWCENLSSNCNPSYVTEMDAFLSFFSGLGDFFLSFFLQLACLCMLTRGARTGIESDEFSVKKWKTSATPLFSRWPIILYLSTRGRRSCASLAHPLVLHYGCRGCPPSPGSGHLGQSTLLLSTTPGHQEEPTVCGLSQLFAVLPVL